MARARKQVEANDTTTQGRGTTMAFEPLTDEELSGVLAGSRTRGAYDTGLAEFLDMNVRGIRVPLDSGPFEDKKPNSVKTGFEGAKKREKAPEGAAHVRVINKDDNIFLVRDDIAS